ncbi:hypothetical protein FIV42_16280 [Persicimonas caeni]|uniref:Uncharacterized protein n=1 Tax=Persicimonas caeni TaxID=2292766 RepID=A0A4Y6PVA3_PERCE|nr:DUF6064 family protein [Persicimonas caeni]QDG52238.1 hypothetical protein FIV42_16280 [Persicimonas caeni]QED33460.1 hypothetical protein FRD00_16275 [Persicimonas caeni]
MELPFSVAEFFDVFFDYNQAIWPAQIVAYALGVFAVGLTAVRSRWAGALIGAVLALFWFWDGLVYHVGFFAEINAMAFVFGGLFVLEGLLFVWATVRDRLRFSFELSAYHIIGGIFLLYALVLYPVFGMALGHVYPAAPVFGVAPCPMTIFTFGILLFTTRKVPLYLLAVPVLWAFTATIAAAQMGVLQDYGVSIAAVVATGLLLYRDHATWEPEPARLPE